MARTAGTIEGLGRASWRVRVYLGEDVNGKRRYLSRSVKGGRKEAEKTLRDLLREKDKGHLRPAAKVSLAAYLDEWLGVWVRNRVRPRTVEYYRTMVEVYVKPALGACRLDKLRHTEIQRWVNDLADRGLSDRTVQAAFATLRTAPRHAVDLKMLPNEPSAYAKSPKRQKRPEVKSFTSDEASAFVAACRGDRLGAFFILALATGCRPGELAALRWQDVDLDKGTVAIKRAMSRVSDEVTYSDPKTDRGNRTIPIPAGSLVVLRKHHQQQLEDRLAAGGEWHDPELVFTDRKGRPLELHNVRNRNLRSVLRRAGLPDSFTLYSLRHTAASLLLAGGVHIKAVSERLGHASTAFTMDTYVHSLPTVQEQAAVTLERMVFGG